MAAEFNNIDINNEDKIIFETLVEWALKKNMQIELTKQEEKEKIEDNGNENHEN